MSRRIPRVVVALFAALALASSGVAVASTHSSAPTVMAGGGCCAAHLLR
jgi:hypothetical protein